MKRITGAVLACVGMAWVVLPGAHADPSFTRAANTPFGRVVFESGPARLDVLSDDVWHLAGQDVVPFDYEQGVAFAGPGMGRGLEGSLVSALGGRSSGRPSAVRSPRTTPSPVTTSVAG